MKPYPTWPLILPLCAAAAFSQQSGKPQKRVSPDVYTYTSANIRAELKKQHCELPETQHWDKVRLNIVSGRFGNPVQTDWAAICIAPDGTTRVHVFWGSSAPCPADIHQGWALDNHLPPGEAGEIYLLSASVKHILGYRNAFGDSHDNPVNHEGIEVGGDKASLIYYCYQGKWLELQGAD